MSVVGRQSLRRVSPEVSRKSSVEMAQRQSVEDMKFFRQLEKKEEERVDYEEWEVRLERLKEEISEQLRKNNPCSGMGFEEYRMRVEERVRRNRVSRAGLVWAVEEKEGEKKEEEGRALGRIVRERKERFRMNQRVLLGRVRVERLTPKLSQVSTVTSWLRREEDV